MSHVRVTQGANKATVIDGSSDALVTGGVVLGPTYEGELTDVVLGSIAAVLDYDAPGGTSTVAGLRWVTLREIVGPNQVSFALDLPVPVAAGREDGVICRSLGGGILWEYELSLDNTRLTVRAPRIAQSAPIEGADGGDMSDYEWTGVQTILLGAAVLVISYETDDLETAVPVWTAVTGTTLAGETTSVATLTHPVLTGTEGKIHGVCNLDYGTGIDLLPADFAISDGGYILTYTFPAYQQDGFEGYIQPEWVGGGNWARFYYIADPTQTRIPPTGGGDET